MGLIYEKDGDYDKALHYYEQALNVKSASKSEIVTVHNNLGFLYYRRGNCKKAREHHKKAFELVDESHPNWIQNKAFEDTEPFFLCLFFLLSSSTLVVLSICI
ncbi:unnamed protein product [Rotaria sordida]|uniref:Uncharacterized protein n=1 Tax=Rotaria sordida TaxID=392033 RepID=A0A815L3T3_9BILA|nr:unnamed protein product [Rotaria sordida]CAF1416763.1 unnamed protein product [Rotaria sordida]CAF1629038.1 unnamed protein product [Rotaria sordida]CAF4103855.1 unnamed protein product [Rotaria sordida]